MRLVDAIREFSKPNPMAQFPDPRVAAATGKSVKVKLADSVQAAKSGTPLRKTDEGYVPSEDKDATLVCATFGRGGAEVHAYRSLTLDIYRNPREVGLPGFYEGDRVRIASLDEWGRPTFERDPRGRWYALSETSVTMSCDQS